MRPGVEELWQWRAPKTANCRRLGPPNFPELEKVKLQELDCTMSNAVKFIRLLVPRNDSCDVSSRLLQIEGHHTGDVGRRARRCTEE